MVTGLPKCRRDGCQKDARREWMESLEVGLDRFSSANINWPTELLSNSTRCPTSILALSPWLTGTHLLSSLATLVGPFPVRFTIVSFITMQCLSPTSSMFSLGFICERLLSSSPAFPFSSANSVGNFVFPSNSISPLFLASVNFDGPW
jgi:hypothetical protein